MATQRYISTSFWDDAWVQSIDPSEKLLYLYLMTNPLTNIAGIYKITDKRIHDDTGFNVDMIIKLLERFKKAGKAHRAGEYIIIPSWPKHQKWREKPTIDTGIRKILSELPKSIRDKAIEVGYLYPMDTIPIPYEYQPSYLDSDSDKDTDMDMDSDAPALPSPLSTPPIQKRDIPTEASKDATARIDRLRTAWNYMGLPECRYTIANFRDYERADCIRAVTFYTDDEIEAAIKNYAGILKSVDHEVFPYKGFTTFMAKGVEQYIDKADPWTVKKRRATEQEQKKAAEYKDRGGFEVPEATCKCCGHTWRTTQSICPKCHYEGGDIEDHKEWYRDRFGHDLE